MPGTRPKLLGLTTDEIENSARLPLPIGERVGVRGQRISTTQALAPSPGRFAADPGSSPGQALSPLGRGLPPGERSRSGARPGGGASRTASPPLLTSEVAPASTEGLSSGRLACGVRKFEDLH